MDRALKQHRLASGLICAVLAALACGLVGCDSRARTAERLAHAQATLDAGDFGRASIELKNVLQSHPDDGEARFALAEASVGVGDFAEAANQLERAARLGVSPARVEPLRWKIELSLGHAREVASALNVARDGLAEPLRLRYLALALIETGRPAEAVERLHGSADADGETRIILARAQADIGHTDEALATLEPLTAPPPLAARAAYTRGEVLLRAGRVADGEAALKSAVSQAANARDRSTTFMAERSLVSSQLSQHRLDEAREGLKGLQTMAPNAVAVHLLTARMALADGHFAAASDLLSELVRTLPADTQARMLLAVALASQGQLGQAESQLDEFLRLDPRSVPGRRMLAEVQMREGRPDAARRTLERIDHDAPLDAGVLLLLARAAVAMGDHEAASRALQRAAALDVEDPLNRLDLAGAFVAVGSPEQALAVLATKPISGASEYRAELLRLLALSAAKRGDEATNEAHRYALAHASDASAQDVVGTFLSVAEATRRGATVLRSGAKDISRRYRSACALGADRVFSGAHSGCRRTAEPVADRPAGLDSSPPGARPTGGGGRRRGSCSTLA